jgi:hypothetical protein
MTVADRLNSIADRVHEAVAEAGRRAGDVTLVGVGKTQPPAIVREAVQAGLAHVGVNFLQEGRAQQAALAGLPLTWHFIGAIQSNKTRPIAEHFDVVHTVDRPKVAERLSAQRQGPPLDVLLQVNVDDEPGKAGVPAGGLGGLAATVSALPNLRLRGLMAIPRPRQDDAGQRRTFARVRALRDDLARELRAVVPAGSLEWLSMGMSADFRAAILEGATHIRIGTALFGDRGGRR